MPEIFKRSVKSLLKCWWFWTVIIIAAGFLVAWITGHRQGLMPNSDTPENTDKKISEQYAYDSSLPDCPADLTGLLDHELIPMNDLDALIPLGNFSAFGGHAIPTDHMYLNHFGEKKIPVYAPGDITLITMDDKITYNSANDEKIHDDYSAGFGVCKGLVIYFNHFLEVAPKISSAWESSEKKCQTDDKWHFGTDQTTYYQPCYSNFKVSLKSGELMGYIGQFAGNHNSAISVDLGAYNYNNPPHAFANPSRYEPGNLHSMCPLDLFTENLRDAYYAKLGDIKIEGSKVIFIPRVGEPLCGVDMQDVPGTLAGNWFVGDSDKGGVTRTQYQITLGHDVGNFSLSRLSILGQEEIGSVVFNFTAAHTGTINREFSEIHPSDIVYCYAQENLLNGATTDKDGKPLADGSAKFLIQLVDPMHMRVEKQTGVCTNNETFINYITFER